MTAHEDSHRGSERHGGLHRRSRVVRLFRHIWRPRMVFWAGALGIGLISVVFAYLADQALALFQRVVGHGGWALPLLITPAGFALCSWLAVRYFPGAEGSGIPQAMAARDPREGPDREQILSLKVVAAKVVLTLVGLFSGASIGREGPTVQVGAALMLKAARWGGMLQSRGLILAGSAAGIAAAFNTPLAGVVFAIEEMGRSYQARTNGLVLSAVILAGLAAIGLAGDYTYFGASNAVMGGARDWLLIAACGLIGGVMGGGFSRIVLLTMRWVRRWARPNRVPRTVAFATLCGLAVALIGVNSGGQTFGTGYDQAKSAIEGDALPLVFFIEKFAAGLASTMSGIPGGIFAPSLSVGAGIGSTLGALSGSDIALAALLGMAAYFAGVTQAPMTAFVIILEMTGNHAAVIPVMCAAMIGYGTARLISPRPLYHALAELIVDDALQHKRALAKADAEIGTAGGGKPFAPEN
jgi:H+/Cl- antiporter ClcA